MSQPVRVHQTGPEKDKQQPTPASELQHTTPPAQDEQLPGGRIGLIWHALIESRSHSLEAWDADRAGFNMTLLKLLEREARPYDIRYTESIVRDKQKTDFDINRLQQIAGEEYPFIIQGDSLVEKAWSPILQRNIGQQPGVEWKGLELSTEIIREIPALAERQQADISSILSRGGVCHLSSRFYPTSSNSSFDSSAQGLIMEMLQDPEFCLSGGEGRAERVLLATSCQSTGSAEWHLYRWSYVDSAADSGRVLVPEAVFQNIPVWLALQYMQVDVLTSMFSQAAGDNLDVSINTNNVSFWRKFGIVCLQKHAREPVETIWEGLPKPVAPRPSWMSALRRDDSNLPGVAQDAYLLAPMSLMIGLMSVLGNFKGVQIAGRNNTALDIQESNGDGTVTGSFQTITVSSHASQQPGSAIAFVAHSHESINHRKHLWC